jgi:hypothetical protein
VSLWPIIPSSWDASLQITLQRWPLLMQAHCSLVAAPIRVGTHIGFNYLIVRANTCLRVDTPILVIAGGRNAWVGRSSRELSFPSECWTEVAMIAIESLRVREHRPLVHSSTPEQGAAVERRTLQLAVWLASGPPSQPEFCIRSGQGLWLVSGLPHSPRPQHFGPRFDP